MRFSLVHLSDPCFGGAVDLAKVRAVLNLIPDLEPDLTVISGDLTHGARHGEFHAAALFVQELQRSGPVYVLPGDRDVQWWRRPLIPFAPAAKYERFRRYFGPVTAPTVSTVDAVVTGAVTAHGLAWGALTGRPRDLRTAGYVARHEADRVSAVFRKAPSDAARVLVLHHHLLPDPETQRCGLVRVRTAQRRLLDTGVDVILEGHDPRPAVDTLGPVVISQAGSLTLRDGDAHPAAFHRVVIEDQAVQVEVYRWEPEPRMFRRTDMLAFARRGASTGAPVPVGVV